MKIIKKHIITLLILAVILLMLSSCVVQIGELNKNPGQYSGQVVQLDVSVNNKFSIPLIGLSIYDISDSTGHIAMISKQDYAVNSSISPKGLFIAFDGKQAGEGYDKFNTNLRDALEKEGLLTKDNAQFMNSIAKAVVNFAQSIKVSMCIVESE